MTNPTVYNSSILNWIRDNKIKNEKGEELSFYDRPFLLDILNDWSQEITIKKCSQVGGSVCFSLKTGFLVSNFNYNIIYTFPTDSDTREFVSTKVNPILTNNSHVFNTSDKDNIELKGINGNFIYFKGTVSKTAAISTTADILIHDEADRSDQKVLVDFKSRTKASKYKARWLFSNPTTDKGATDEAWKVSDQKEWCVPCPHCKVADYLTFPQSVDFKEKTFICKHCKGVIADDDRRAGSWVAQQPGAEVSGYHMSHLMCPWIQAKEIIADSKLDQEYFYNFVLGEPYNPGDLSVTKTTIMDIWTPRPLETQNYYLGVDVGNIKHYVLGSELGIIKCGTFTKPHELDDMMKMYKPALVIDALPDTTLARYAVDHYDNALMWFPQDNDANPQKIVWYGEGEREGVIYTNRNRILDQMITAMVEGEFLINLPADSNFRDYIKHFLTLRRIKEVNSKGIERYVWDSTTGEDHYVFATLYWYLARISVAEGVVMSGSGNPIKQFIGENNIVGDIRGFIENRDW